MGQGQVPDKVAGQVPDEEAGQVPGKEAGQVPDKVAGQVPNKEAALRRGLLAVFLFGPERHVEECLRAQAPPSLAVQPQADVRATGALVLEVTGGVLRYTLQPQLQAAPSEAGEHWRALAREMATSCQEWTKAGLVCSCICSVSRPVIPGVVLAGGGGLIALIGFVVELNFGVGVIIGLVFIALGTFASLCGALAFCAAERVRRSWLAVAAAAAVASARQLDAAQPGLQLQLNITRGSWRPNFFFQDRQRVYQTTLPLVFHFREQRPVTAWDEVPAEGPVRDLPAAALGNAGPAERARRAAEDAPEDAAEDAAIPSHWLCRGAPGDPECRLVDAEAAVRQDIERALAETFRGVATRDRDGRLPERLRLVKCHRVENPALWQRYCGGKARLAAKLAKLAELAELRAAGHGGLAPTVVGAPALLPSDAKPADGKGATEGGVEKVTARTSTALGGTAAGLDASINELYLWHGTSPSSAMSITEAGFRLDLAGHRTGAMFGEGVYFAECSTKADEYSAQGDGVFTGIYAMLLCRVACGRMLRLARPDAAAVASALADGSFQSVLGDREAAVGTFREFVTFDPNLVYPDHIVLYERCG